MKKIATLSALCMLALTLNAKNNDSEETKSVAMYHTVAIERNVEVIDQDSNLKPVKTLVEVNTHMKEGKAYICLENDKDRKSFINYLTKVRAKFGEWKAIAEKNNIKDITTGFNFTSPMFRIYWNEDGKWYSSYEQLMNFKFYISPAGDCYVISGGNVNDAKDNSISKFWNLNFHYDYEFVELMDGIASSKPVVKETLTDYSKLFR